MRASWSPSSAAAAATSRKAAALDHVAGYSIFNDGSIRDYQFKAPQWTMGKNFDGTGAFGPVFVTADELPPGARRPAAPDAAERRGGAEAPRPTTWSSTSRRWSPLISEAITLEPGDIIVTGTPAGVGAARKPPLWMKPGDVCEVEIERHRHPAQPDRGRSTHASAGGPERRASGPSGLVRSGTKGGEQ